MVETEIWSDVQRDLAATLETTIYERWLKDTYCLETKGTSLRIAVPREATKRYLEQGIAHHVRHSLRMVGAENYSIEYVVQSQAASLAPDRPARSSGRRGGDQSHDDMTPLFPTRTVPTLIPRYTFETFVLCPASNMMAVSAARAVADNLATAYNPLFIYGGVGLGKTHLLHAIGHEAVRQNPNRHVLYISSEDYVNHFISTLPKGQSRMEEFRQTYRHVDVLMIDDIQFLAGKESTQEEFFHTFNALHNAQKQIVLCSDRPPRSLNTLEERLRSRLDWGLPVSIALPTLEERIVILRTKAQAQNIPIPADVLEIIAHRVESNVRELERNLNLVLHMAHLQKSAVTRDLALRALGTMEGIARQRQPSLQEVILAVGQHFKIDQSLLVGKGRDKATSLPRQIAMYIMREDARASLPSIGAVLGGRDHTTILHGCFKISNELEHENAQIRRDILAVRKMLVG